MSGAPPVLKGLVGHRRRAALLDDEQERGKQRWVMAKVWPVLGFVGISSALAAPLWWFSGMPFWGCWIVAAGAVFANGIIADWEDNRPGGFNNPA